MCMIPCQHHPQFQYLVWIRMYHTVILVAHGDGHQLYSRKILLVMTAVPFFMTANCQRDGTGQKWVQTAIYGRYVPRKF